MRAGGRIRARASGPELRVIERLGLAGIIAIGDLEGPFQDELVIASATWLSAPKVLDAARQYSHRERGRRVELWTCGDRHRDRVRAELKQELAALGVVVRGNCVRMEPQALETEIRAAGSRAGVSVFGVAEAQRLIDEGVRRDLMRGF